MPRLINTKRIQLFLLYAFLLTALFFFIPSFFAGLKGVVIRLLTFPGRAVSGVAGHFHSIKELEKENRILRGSVGELALKLESFDVIKSENDRLRELLDFRTLMDFGTVSAEVIARDPNDWIDSFVIDRGTADGISKGAAVCSAKGLLGIVAEARKKDSTVILVTHPSFKSGGMIRRTRVNGIIKGSGKGSARLLYLPLDADVQVGDEVITSEISRFFPKGLMIGRIVSLEKSKTGLFKMAMIEPAATSFSLEEVLCIK